MLVVKIALGIVLAFVIIEIGQLVLAAALIGSIGASLPRVATPTYRISAGSPFPLALATPLPPDPGKARLSVTVLDASTGRPVQGVCVVVGAPANCDRGLLLTDVNGHWEIDVAATSQSVSLSMSGYISEQRPLSLVSGGTATYTIVLRRSG